MREPAVPAARDLAISIHAAAVAGVDPRAATSRAVATRLAAVAQPIWVIAVGKAAMAMAAAACATFRAQDRRPEGGVIVAPEMADSPDPRLTVAEGDHPVPSTRSYAAAEIVGALTKRIGGRGT